MIEGKFKMFKKLFNIGNAKNRDEYAKFDEKLVAIVNGIIPNSRKLIFSAYKSFTKVGTQVEGGRIASVNEFNNLISACLSELLEKRGFKFLKSKNEFKRTFDNGTDIIYWISNGSLHYNFHFFANRRIDEVQKKITEFNFLYKYNSNPKFKDFYTAWSEFPKFSEIREIHNMEELRIFLLEYMTLLIENILTVMEEMNDSKNLNLVLNKNAGTNIFGETMTNKAVINYTDRIIIAECAGDKDTADSLRTEIKKSINKREKKKLEDLEEYIISNLP